MMMRTKATRVGRTGLWMAAALLAAMTSDLSAQSTPKGAASGPAATSTIGGNATLDVSPTLVSAARMHTDPPPFTGYCGGVIDVREREQIVAHIRLAWVVVLLRSGLHLGPAHGLALGSAGLAAQWTVGP